MKPFDKDDAIHKLILLRNLADISIKSFEPGGKVTEETCSDVDSFCSTISSLALSVAEMMTDEGARLESQRRARIASEKGPS